MRAWKMHKLSLLSFVRFCPSKLGIYDRKIRRVIERIRGLAEQEGLAPE